MSTDAPVTQTLDVSGLSCPQPLMKTKKAIQGLPVGGLLEVTSTDPGSLDDFPSFCQATGHELVAHKEERGAYVFLLRRAK